MAKYDRMTKEEITCPFCGSTSVYVHGDGRYVCDECQIPFDNADLEWWGYYNKISAILIDTCEEKPLACHITIGEDEAVGLSTLQLPTITELFQEPCEGIIWYKVYGNPNWHPFDIFSLDGLKSVYQQLLDMETEAVC